MIPPPPKSQLTSTPIPYATPYCSCLARPRRPGKERSTPRNAARSIAPPQSEPSMPPLPVDGVEPGLTGEIVLRLDHADGAALGTHHQRMGHRTAGEAAHALEHRAAGAARGGEHHLAVRPVEHAVLAVAIV